MFVFNKKYCPNSAYILMFLTLIHSFDCFYDNENKTYGNQENVLLGRKLWPPIRLSPRKTLDFHNFTVYLGYANNPFGPSTRVLNKKKTVNITEALYGKGSPTSFNEIKFAPAPEPQALLSNVDTGPRAGLLSETALSSQDQEQRSKRGVVHLYNMVSCATGCNPLIYKGYGCYCGFLGSGYAVDGIDRCCKMHDWCYDTAKCPMFLEYFVPYLWKCYHNRPLCAVSHGEWGGPGSCAQRLCECDRALSQCLRRYPCPSSRALCRSSPWRLIQNALMTL